MAQRMAELSQRVLIVELDLNGFAAGARRFGDDSWLTQFDNGLLLTILGPLASVRRTLRSRSRCTTSSGRPRWSPRPTR